MKVTWVCEECGTTNFVSISNNEEIVVCKKCNMESALTRFVPIRKKPFKMIRDRSRREEC